MVNWLRIAGLASLLAVLATAPVSADAAERATVRLQQEWIAYSGFAGEAVAALDKTANPAIRLLEGSEIVDPIKVVLSGKAEFGVASADLLISAVANGAPLVAVGVVSNDSPTCFIAKGGLSSPQDFVGKKVGILRGTNTEKIYRLLLARSKIDRSAIKEIDVSFDLKPFVLGRYDIRPAFIYDEPVKMKLQYKKDVSILKPSDFGIDFLGTVYFTTKRMAREDPETVRRFVAAIANGWQTVGGRDGVELGIHAVKELFPAVDVAVESEALTTGLPFFMGPRGTMQPLKAADGQWQSTISGLEALKAIPVGKVRVGDVWNSSFIEAAYQTGMVKK